MMQKEPVSLGIFVGSILQFLNVLDYVKEIRASHRVIARSERKARTSAGLL